MLGVNESRRRDKQDTMMTFIILKMLHDAVNKEEIRKRAEEYMILGRVKLIDQTLYEMAKNRRRKKECPTTPPENSETNASSAVDMKRSAIEFKPSATSQSSGAIPPRAPPAKRWSSP